MQSHYLSLIGTHHATYIGLRFQSIPNRSWLGFGDSQPESLGLLLPHSHSQSGIDQLSLNLSTSTIEFRLPLDRIGPMSRNPKREVGRVLVVRARSPSLSVRQITKLFLNTDCSHIHYSTLIEAPHRNNRHRSKYNITFLPCFLPCSARSLCSSGHSVIAFFD